MRGPCNKTEQEGWSPGPSVAGGWDVVRLGKVEPTGFAGGSGLGDCIVPDD